MSYGFYTDIERDTLDNEEFRTDIITIGSLQLVVMSIPPNGEIGMETHDVNTQFTRIESGLGVAIIGDETFAITDGSAVIIPPGVSHNIINVSPVEPLKLYSLYSPPE